MKMQMLMMVAAAVLAMSVAARGADTEQPRPDPQGRGVPGMMLDRCHQMVLDLKLTEEQQTEIKGLFADARQKIRKQIEEGKTSGTDRKAIREAVRDILQKLRQDVGAVLTDEQKEILKKKMEAARERGKRMVQHRMIERVKHALSRLELSAEQKEKVEAVLEEAKTRVEALRAQFKEQKPPADAREKLKAIFDDVREKIDAILTPEQAAKLKKMIEARRGERPGVLHRRPADEDAATPAAKPTPSEE